MNPFVSISQTGLVTFMASVMIWVMFVGLGVLWVIDGRVKKEIVLHTIIAVVIAYVVSDLFKELFSTPRPYLVSGENPLTFTNLHQDGAFPSAHAAVAFSLATSVFLHNKKLGWVFVFSAVLVGVGRVLSNVHYPIDIIGGVILGVLVAFVIAKVHMFELLKKL